jgi:L-glutamine-phosphate cytidylyltransferase
LKGIILAAGQGVRLRPLTNTIPKCMVNLFGKPIIEWQINTFYNCGIRDISVVTGYKSEKIISPNVSFFHNKSYKTTNMLESLFCVREKLTGPIVVSYGDIVFEDKILKKILESKEDISVIVDKNWKRYWKLRFSNILDDAESMIIDDEGFIQNLGQKVHNIEKICGQYIGLMKFSSKGVNTMLELYDKAKLQSNSNQNILNAKIPFEKSYMTDFLQYLINNGQKIKAVEIKNGWLELDSINDYNLYHKMYEEGKIMNFYKVN